MTSRADTKVLTVGQICIGERAWSAAKCVVAALPRTLWHLSCLSWMTFFIAPARAELFCPPGQVPVRRSGWSRIDTSQRAISTVSRPRNGIWAPVPNCHPTGHPSTRPFTVTEE
jgi:hypothetical protein